MSDPEQYQHILLINHRDTDACAQSVPNVPSTSRKRIRGWRMGRPKASGARGKRAFGSLRKLPSGRWQARYSDPVTGERVTSPKTFVTKTDAALWLDIKRTDTERGVVLDDRAARSTLADWWPDYFESIQRRLRPSTVTSYEQAWRLRVKPTFGSMEVRRIKPGLVDDWIADLADKGHAPTKIHQAGGVLKRLLDRAVRDDASASNPMSKRAEPLPRLPKTERPVLEPSEVYELAGAMKHDEDALLVKVLMFLGLRIGEAFALQRGDLNLRQKTVTIRRSVGENGTGRIVISETKTRRERTLAIPDQLARELTKHLKSQAPLSGGLPERDALVFPRKDGGYRRYGNFRRDSWNPAVKRVNDARAKADARRAKASGKPVKASPRISCTPHDLRGTCASLLIDSGASVRDVADYLGHADIATTLNLYARVRPGRSTEVARRMDEIWRASIGGTPGS